eukprot:12919702-Prorocentrum_lima.AAC.1
MAGHGLHGSEPGNPHGIGDSESNEPKTTQQFALPMLGVGLLLTIPMEVLDGMEVGICIGT